MSDRTLPSVDAPLILGPHQMYFVDDEILVVIYDGEVTPEHGTTIVNFLLDAKPKLTSGVIDVERMGSVGTGTRKFMGTEPVKKVYELFDPEFVMFLAKADVVRRALMTIVGTAGSLVSKKRIRLRFFSSLEDATSAARVYCQTLARKRAGELAG